MKELLNPVSIGQLGISLFIAIVFLQSALDKTLDWSNNLTWLQSHFSKTFLKSIVTPMLLILTIIEFIAGAMGLIGAYCLLCCQDPMCALYAVILSMVAYLMLIFGQRLAKDYDGAKTIAIYFGVSLISLLYF